MKKVVLLILLLGCITCNAQNFCQTPQVADEANISALNMRLMQGRSATVNNSKYRLRVYMHVIRKSDGTGGHSYLDVQNSMTILNSDFNPYDIYFLWNGTIDYINDSSLYNYADTTVFSINNHIDGIDIYLFPDEVTNPQGKANGVGNGSAFFIGGMFSSSISYVPSHAISHEMGHVLFLYHTHHGTCYENGGDSNQCPEFVDGSNSDCCGDYIEDTPADPNINFNVNITTFQWLGSGYDQHGDPYTPDTQQIMSYTDIRCMSHFSPGQVERMYAAIESLSHLQSALMPFIDGTSIPCGEETYKVESLPNGCSTVWSWKYGSSLPIVQGPSSTNQCSITNNNHAYINDTLVATVYKNGNVVHTLEKAINTGCNFAGTYKQAPHNYTNWNYPGQAATAFNDGETFMVFKGTTITLRSDKFINANITHSGIPALSWTHSGDSVTFFFAYFEPNDPLPRSLVPSSINAMTVDVIYNTCEHSRFYIMGTPPLNPTLLSPNVQMNRQGQSIIFSRNDVEENPGTSSVEAEPEVWTLTIANLATGKIMYQSRTDADWQEVNIRDWPTGIYVVNVQMGTSSTSAKFKL